MDLFTTLIFDLWSVLAQSLIFGSALTAGVWIALRVFLPANASTRFAIWLLTLLALALMPVVIFWKEAVPRLDNAKSGPGFSRTSEQPRVLPSLPLTQPAAPRISGPTYSLRPDDSFRPKLELGADAAAGALGIYVLLVAILLIGRLGSSYMRLKRFKSTTTDAPPEVADRFIRWRSLCQTSRPVRLLLSSEARSPMAVGFLNPAVIIPDALLLKLTGEELDHLGVHELAHIRRYDDWTNLAQRVIRAFLMFHPAVHWICRRLDFEREVACDDWVLSTTGEAKPYAKSLAKILESAPWTRGPVLASGAVFAKRQIFKRIKLLLDRSRDSRPQISGVTIVVVIVCLVGAFSQIIDIPALIAFDHPVGGRSFRSSWQADGRSIETVIRGEVEFGDDDISVRSISPGGYLRVREEGWRGQVLEFRPGASGRPEARYSVGGRERPFDEKAQAWARSILSLVIRENGIDAEVRAIRILDKQGTSGLFAELDRISSDHSRRRYLLSAIESGRLDPEGMRRAVSRAGRLSSDHEKAELLSQVANLYSSAPLRAPYFDAVNTITSDHDRRRVLTKVLQTSGDDPAVVALATRSVEEMSSDHDKSEVLRSPALRSTSGDVASQHSLIRAAETISSDHDKANVIRTVLSEGPLLTPVLEDL
ncbi:MAG TPA: M56 family metallopeptidase, partial [Bryobacteraceae bacterium]|nr:M56 family metallopeptidase [Bryobacteraceae bacterium]